MLKYPTLRLNASLAGTFYFISNYNYYGSLFGVQALKASIYFNSVFSALSDLIGNILIEPILKRFQRKIIYLITFLIVMLSSISFFYI